jgi:hypothetical protein
MRIKHVAVYIAGATAAAAAAAMLTVAPANAADEWAMIVYSPSTGVIGFGANVPYYADAERVAMQDCTAGGGTDCQRVAWIMNGCAALAISDDGSFHGGMGPDMATAADDALALNGGGAIQQIACAL